MIDAYDSDSNSIVVASYVSNTDESQLESDFWESSPHVHIRKLWSGDPAPASRHAEARLCWNDEQLMVRFVCEQHEPLVITDNPVTKHKTIGLWDRDVCEIFLAPDSRNPDRYFEFEAAPTGEWVDLAILKTPSGRETEWDYASGMTTSTKIEPETVIVAMSIPWSARIPRPDVGEEWRANLFRCVGPDEATRYLAWRPTRTSEPNFHVPDAFGVLRFA
jgi:Carbohydrate family 9 binding domain-like